ncbi:MAG: hypothetical protein SFY69_08430 [Planctomycetota bacterium]|nr:hypothetical protein [Planctomycetota bacterium]
MTRTPTNHAAPIGRRARAWGCALALLASLAGGCASRDRVDRKVEAAALRAEYGVARQAIEASLSDNPSDKSYLLDRMRLLILTLADGQPDAAEIASNELYNLLRTQGLNDDRTVRAAVFNERVKIWKGEPFEQAMAYSYIALQKAMRGEWDNTRAAAQSSLFLLRDFGENERGERVTRDDLARRAAQADASGRNGDALIENGYVPARTTFTLGYLLNAVANKALGRDAEARDNLREAVAIDPALEPLARQLEAGGYNTVLVVDYGRGPAKVAYGPDDALARFQPLTPADARPLLAQILPPSGVPAGQPEGTPVAADLNAMATDLMWNSLESVREAKSVIGTVLIAGGAVLATSGGNSDEERRNRALVGAGLILAGALLKAGASADTRHCEFLPQRVYLVPLTIDVAASSILLEVAGDSASRTALAGLNPPADGRLQLRYVRLGAPGASDADWRRSTRVVYANDEFPWRVPGDDLPYIFGGRCVRTPTPEVMKIYHDAGNLTWMSSTELANLYREEGITFEVEAQQGRSRLHVLEGGTSLVCPLPGTIGYQRLFAQEHRAYKPVSDALKDAIARYRAGSVLGAGTRTITPPPTQP